MELVSEVSSQVLAADKLVKKLV